MDIANPLVAQNVRQMAPARESPTVVVQIGAADGGGAHADDGVGLLEDRGHGERGDGDGVGGAVEGYGAHGGVEEGGHGSGHGGGSVRHRDGLGGNVRYINTSASTSFAVSIDRSDFQSTLIP